MREMFAWGGIKMSLILMFLHSSSDSPTHFIDFYSMSSKRLADILLGSIFKKQPVAQICKEATEKSK